MKRYKHEDSGMHECPDGDYVTYVDYEKLRQYTKHDENCCWFKWQTLDKPSCDCGLE